MVYLPAASAEVSSIDELGVRVESSPPAVWDKKVICKYKKTTH